MLLQENIGIFAFSCSNQKGKSMKWNGTKTLTQRKKKNQKNNGIFFSKRSDLNVSAPSGNQGECDRNEEGAHLASHKKVDSISPPI